MVVKLKNKGYTIMIDALVALIFLLIIVTAIFSIKYSGTSKTGVMSFRELHYMSEDTLDVLNKKGILDEIATLWAENSTPGSEEMVNASNLAREYLEKMLPPGVGYKLIIEEGVNSFVINSSNESRIPWNDSTTRTHSTRVLVGYGSGLPTFGHVSRASLKSISNKLASDYVYFGGFVGQGNITRFLDLPSDANVTSAYMELNPGADFDLYINGAPCGHYTGMGWNLTARSWDLNSSCFSGGRNTININFTENESNFIGGGYIRVDYRTGEWNRTPDLNTYWFPGIKGLINLYSGFYVPGDIQNMKINLHYENNIKVKNKGATIYMTLGGKRIYNDSTLGERNVTLDTDDGDIISEFGGWGPFRSKISKKTVPIKFGTDPFSMIGVEGTADVVLITDLSGSMKWRIDNDSTGKIRSCNDSNLYDNDTRRISLAKCLDKKFIEKIMWVPGNRMGLVGFNQDADDYTQMNLTKEELLTSVDGYTDDPSGWTCICCAINRAKEMLKNSPYMGDLIPKKSDWRFNNNSPISYPPYDNESDNWTSLDYNDSDWGTGNSILGFPGDEVDTLIGNNLVINTMNYIADNYSVLEGIVTKGDISDTSNIDGNTLDIESIEVVNSIINYYNESEGINETDKTTYQKKVDLNFISSPGEDYLLLGSALLAGEPNFKVELYGDYDDPVWEYSSISIEGEDIGPACFGIVCHQCSDWDVGLVDNIDTTKYCGDNLLEVTFVDSPLVMLGAMCPSQHKACIRKNGIWHCCNKTCSSGGCINHVIFNCTDWSCVIEKPPTYSQDNDTSGGLVPVGTTVNVSVLWNDSDIDPHDLDYAILHIDYGNDGSWEEHRLRALSGQTDWYNDTINTVGYGQKEICWYQTANDTGGLINDTMPEHCFYVGAEPPAYSNVHDDAGPSVPFETWVNVSVLWDDTDIDDYTLDRGQLYVDGVLNHTIDFEDDVPPPGQPKNTSWYNYSIYTGDEEPPRYSSDDDDHGSSVLAGTIVKITIFWTKNETEMCWRQEANDTGGLLNDSMGWQCFDVTAKYNLFTGLFYTNISGSWQLDGTHTFMFNAEWFNVSLDTTGHAGETICWYQWANDTGGLTSQTPTHCFYVGGNPPTYSNVHDDAGPSVPFETWVNVSVLWDDTDIDDYTLDRGQLYVDGVLNHTIDFEDDVPPPGQPKNTSWYNYSIYTGDEPTPGFSHDSDDVGTSVTAGTLVTASAFWSKSNNTLCWYQTADDTGGLSNTTMSAHPECFDVTPKYDLDTALFRTNESGNWQNVSSCPLSGISDWCIKTIDTTNQAGETICWNQWANDSSGEWNKSMPYTGSDHCFQVTGTPPTYSQDNDNASGSVDEGEKVKVYTLWDDADGDQYNLSSAEILVQYNGGGWNSEKICNYGTEEVAWCNTTIDTAGHAGEICWREIASDTGGLINNSMPLDKHCFRVEAPPKAEEPITYPDPIYKGDTVTVRYNVTDPNGRSDISYTYYTLNDPDGILRDSGTLTSVDAVVNISNGYTFEFDYVVDKKGDWDVTVLVNDSTGKTDTNFTTFNVQEAACTEAKFSFNGKNISTSRFEARNEDEWYGFGGHKVISGAGLQNSGIWYRVPQNPTGKIKMARIAALNVTRPSYKAEDEIESSTSSTNWKEKLTLNKNFAPGEYLIIATADVTANSTNNSIEVQLTKGDSPQREFSREPTRKNEFYTFATHRKFSLSGVHKFKIRYRSKNGGRVSIKNARITAIRLTSFFYAESENEEGTGSDTSYHEKISLDLTPPSPGEYLVIASALVRQVSPSSLCAAYTKLEIDGENQGEQIYYPKDNSDWVSFFTLKKVNFNSTLHNIKIKYRSSCSGGAYETRIKNASIIAIRLSPEYSGIGITANSTNVSYKGKLQSINVTVRFNSSASTWYQMLIYNFNTSTWESDGCDGRNVTKDTPEDFWCNKAVNLKNYLSPDDKIKVAFGTFDTGLVGEWNFDEGSGNTAHDSSGYGNDGTIHGANWTTGKFGNALEFDGSDDYVSVDDNDQQLAPDALTFEAWIKVLSGWSNSDRIVSKKGSLSWNAASGWSLEINTGGMMTFLGSGGTYGDRLSMGWQQDTWHHVAITKEAGATVVKGYLDGQYKDNQSCNTISPNTQPLTLAFYPNEDRYAPIIIDQVRIYNRALSPEEIKASYEAGGAQIKNLTIKPQAQPIKTQIDFIQFYVTSSGGNYYFRKKFTVDNVSRLINTTLRVYSDDMAEVYLNGFLVDNDTAKHNATYWNREISIDSSHLNDGDNIIAVKLHNYDNISAKFDLELSATEKRRSFIVVMSDGIPTHHCGECGGYPACPGSCENTTGTFVGGGCTGGTENCIGTDCSAAMNDSICSSCKAKSSEINSTVYAIGIGPVTVGCTNALTTLREIANCGGGKYCGSAEAKEVEKCYLEFAEEIVNLSYEAQLINISGNLTMDSTLYPDSNIWFGYSPITAPIKYGETLITLESSRFGNKEGNGSFWVPLNTRPVDAKVTSYSGPYWTDKLTVNSSNTTWQWKKAYDLSGYGGNYESLGDPYTVNIPADMIGKGVNFVKIGTGKSPTKSMNASPDDKVIYTIATKTFTGYSEPKKNTEGCNWTVEFFDDTTENLLVPLGYIGPKNCNYTSTSIVYDNQSSVDVATYRLFSQLDAAPMDGRLDVKFDPEDITIETTTVGGIRSLWGPIRVKLILWM